MDRKELIAKAEELGLSFSKNISTAKLEAEVNEALGSQEPAASGEQMGHALATPKGSESTGAVFQVQTGKNKGTFKVSSNVTIIRN